MLKNDQVLRSVAILGLSVIVVLLATACGGSAAPNSPEPAITPSEAVILADPIPEETTSGGPAQADDTLRLLYWQAPTTLNPHLSGSTKDKDASRLAYEPLASIDQHGNLIPFLAAEIPSLENGGIAPDGKSVTWKLKPGVKWSDGQPFTADDVLFTYEFITNPETGATTTANYEAIESVQVIDDLTVKINFKEVNPVWTEPFVRRWGMILPRHVFEAYNNAQAGEASANLAPVGTDPYRGVEYKTEDILIIGGDVVNVVKIVYEPNPFFREAGKPYFSRVELQGGGDATVAARAVLAEGVVDFAWNLQVDAATLAGMEATGTGQVVSAPGSDVERIMLNRTDPNRETESGERSSIQFPHPFFSDKRVRQAFAHAIDRETIAAFYGHNASPTTNYLVGPSVYNSPNTAGLYDFDLARAADLLDEAGWVDTDQDGIRDKEGVKMSVVFQTTLNPVRQQTQEIVKEALESLGVEVELKVIDASVFFNPDPTNTNNAWHFYADMQEYFAGSAFDPGVYMRIRTCSEIPQQANNWAGLNIARWCNPEYDALYEQSTVELDPERRRQLFILMNDMLIEDVALIPLVNLFVSSGVSHTLKGVELTPWDSHMWNIKDWRREQE